MRLIFISLLVINIVIAAWGLFVKKVEAPEVSQASSLDGGQLPAVIAASDVWLNNDQGHGKPSALCEMIGPFDTREGADDFIQRLDSIGVAGLLNELELPAGESFWVHLPAEVSPEAAYRRLSELQAQGMESYVIRKGELENAISLGVFTFKDLAERRRKEIAALDLAAEIRVVKRTEIEMWVILKEGEEQKMSEFTWGRVLDGLKLQERRQNFCLPVASEDNIQ